MAVRPIGRSATSPIPDSRILPTRDGFVQGYNGQIAVDAAHQVIVAHRLVTNSADSRALVPLIDDARAHLGRKPREVSGDAGFANVANLAALQERGITGYLAPGRARHGEADAAGRRRLTKMPLMSAMAARLKRAGRRSRYRLRKQVAEPVFGQMKQARGFRQFLMRGLDQVRRRVGNDLHRPQPPEAGTGPTLNPPTRIVCSGLAPPPPASKPVTRTGS
jgi:hypothetical protein